jgi:predicted aspartyl protease
MKRLIGIQGFAVKGEHCFVTALFVCDHLGIKAPVKSLVDTGNTHTALTEATAARLGVNVSGLPEKVRISGIGGSSRGCQLAGIRLIFTTVDGRRHEESLPFVWILKNPVPRNEDERKALEQIPDLLGLDVIRRFTLRFDKNLVYLECK